MPLLLSILFLIIFGSVAYAATSFAPWVPMWKKDLPRIFKLAELKPGEVYYDLGCGNGKTVFYAAKLGAKAIGIELALPLYIYCQIKRLFYLNLDITFKLKNLFNEDLSLADVIYFFGMPKPILSKLKAKLEKELKPGTRVISYVFPIEGWQPVVIDKSMPKDVDIYLYTIK